MGCPGLVLHPLFLLSSPHWLTTMGRALAFLLLQASEGLTAPHIQAHNCSTRPHMQVEPGAAVSRVLLVSQGGNLRMATATNSEGRDYQTAVKPYSGPQHFIAMDPPNQGVLDDTV